MTALAATLGPSAYWYLTRATGVVALVLLTVSVVLGILGSVRFSAGRRWPRFAIDTLHRDVSLLVIVLVVIHIVTTVLDGFAPITLLDGVVPFRSPYRPVWLGLGALSFDLLIALVVTSLLRRRLGYSSWRTVHWLAYVSWPVAVLHGLGTGTDVKSAWLLALTLACVCAVAYAILVRIARAESVDSGVRAGASVLSVAVPMGLVVFTIVGPLQTGWARRAGTPLRLLGAVHPVTRSTTPPQPVSTASLATKPPLERQFTASLSGAVSQTQAPGGAIIELGLRLGGQVSGQMRIRLGGAPLPDGGLSLTGSQVDLIGPGLPSAMAGKVVSLDGDNLVAQVSDVSGATMNLRANLAINQDTGGVTGTLTGTPSGGRG